MYPSPIQFETRKLEWERELELARTLRIRRGRPGIRERLARMLRTRPSDTRQPHTHDERGTTISMETRV